MLRPSLLGLLLFVCAPPIAAFQARRLNEALPLGRTEGSVRSFQVTPDESRVVYLADPDVVGRVELLSVALTGPVLPDGISAPFLDEVTGFSLGLAGERVVYAGRRDSAFRLYSTRIDGSSASIRLTSTKPSRFRVDPAGTRVVFTQ